MTDSEKLEKLKQILSPSNIGYIEGVLKAVLQVNPELQDSLARASKYLDDAFRVLHEN